MEQLETLVINGRPETGSQLAADVVRCVRGLLAHHCGAGDRIAVLMRNCREQLIVTLSAQHIGAYPVQMNWHSQPAELHYVLDDCGAKLIAGHTDLLGALDRSRLLGTSVLAVQPGPEITRAYRIPAERLGLAAGDLEWDRWIENRQPTNVPAAAAIESIIYTSGTTGNPKGVRRFAATPQQVQLTEKLRLTMTGIDSGARVLVPAPLYHTAPHTFAMRAVRRAQALIIPARFDPLQLLVDIERFRITHVYTVPTMFVRLLALPEAERKRHDLSSMQFALHAGGPCAPTVKRAMIDWWGPIIHEYYGSTEAGAMTFCTSEDSLLHPGTIGRALDGVEIEIRDENGNVLPAGEIGELYVRNSGYPDFTYLNRDEDRAALQQCGMMATGDVGFRDADGYYYLSDRKRDMVISGSVNIYPAEIEAALLELPQVADCAVFGVPDEEYGEGLAAVVQLHAGRELGPDEIRGHLRGRLAAFKVPRIIELRECLPRDESGKIRKRVLREPYWEPAGRQI